MDVEITQNESPRLITVKLRGRFTLEGCRAAAVSVADVKDPLCPMLIDDREVDFGGVTPDLLMEVDAIFSAHARVFSYSKMAALVLPEAVPVAEQWSRLSNSGSSAKVAIFIDEREAVDWLTEPGSPTFSEEWEG